MGAVCSGLRLETYELTYAYDMDTDVMKLMYATVQDFLYRISWSVHLIKSFKITKHYISDIT